MKPLELMGGLIAVGVVAVMVGPALAFSNLAYGVSAVFITLAACAPSFVRDFRKAGRR